MQRRWKRMNEIKENLRIVQVVAGWLSGIFLFPTEITEIKNEITESGFPQKTRTKNLTYAEILRVSVPE